MKELIVNADDFGFTQRVSQGILAAHRNGLVTSATLMANGAAFSAAVAISRRMPDLGIGVHLNLTQGEPISAAHQIPSLVDARGQLHLTPGRLWIGILGGRVNLHEVEIELRAQIARVVTAGIFPTHLDGHKHVHVLPGVDDIVARLAQEFGIQSVRCPAEGAPDLHRFPAAIRGACSAAVKQWLVARGVSRMARPFREKLIRAGLASPAHFFGLSETGFLDEESLAAALHRVSDGTSELMCHPGYMDLDLRQAGTRLLAQREAELRALTSPRAKAIIALEGIQLVSYRQLTGSAQAGQAA